MFVWVRICKPYINIVSIVPSLRKIGISCSHFSLRKQQVCSIIKLQIFYDLSLFWCLYLTLLEGSCRFTFLLSSRTVFMFSIQTASTGPSNMIHFRSMVVEDACSRKVLARTPEIWNKPRQLLKRWWWWWYSIFFSK